MPDVAIEGFDPVSYFDGRPSVGRAEITHKWNGQLWQFRNENNRDRFAASPERFAPAFAGNCAFAMSLNKTATASPRHWLLRHGRLYFQQNAVARLLFRMLPGRIDRAEANWRARHPTG